MTAQKHRTIYISAPVKGTIYVLELARKGCRKLVSSAMPEIVDRARPLAENLDSLIPLAKVPLWIRREARLHLGLNQNPPY